MQKKGLLIVNLGTPKSPDTRSVKIFLRELLSDPMVMDINPVLRKLLVELIIVPFRSSKSAEAYRKIWTERGSPLLYHSLDLADAVAGRLGAGWMVEAAMRYGEPSVNSALLKKRDEGVKDIVVLPLYPQDAASTRGSVEVAVRSAAQKNRLRTGFIPSFYDDPGYIRAVAKQVMPVLRERGTEHLLFSFHGLPEKHVKKSDPSGSHCLSSPDCCTMAVEANKRCYRFQSFQIASSVAKYLGLESEGIEWGVSFQSRMGRQPWIGPSTDETLLALADKGVKKVAVLCPSFTADCLETLEEIGIRARDLFREASGGVLNPVPCVNSSEAWVDAVVAMACHFGGKEGFFSS